MIMNRRPPHSEYATGRSPTIAQEPQHPTAEQWFHRAVELQADNQADVAIECYRAALRLSPTMWEAHYNIGIVFFSLRHWQQSIFEFEKALDLNPGFAHAALNLATAFQESGQFDKAIHMYRVTLEKDSGLAQAHYLKGRCHLSMGSPVPAARSIRHAVALEPRNAQYWFHLAEAFLSFNDIASALAAYQKVITLRPGWDAAHYNYAVALRLAERLADAIDHAKQALRINPDYVKAYPLLFRLAQHTCNWRLSESVSKRLDGITRAELDLGKKTTEPPMTSLRRHSNARVNMEIARSWSRHYSLVAEQMPVDYAVMHRPAVSGRIRVGYLSSDFRDHAVAFQIKGLLEKHDRHLFEIFGYACNPDDGTAYRRRLADACDHFHDVHACPNPSIAKQIRDDGIDILVDMAGHSRGNRLGIAAMRPAPVQINYLGFLGTTGAEFIDYVIADFIVVPKDHAENYTEKIIYLPYCYQANDDQMPIARQNQSRAQWHLPDPAFIFCSFNQPYKICADLFGAWMNILKRVDHSVLWLVERSSLARVNLCRAAERAQVDPKRLLFTGFVPLHENLSRLQLADLALDTLIYNGGATTANALWAGVPVLSVLGNHWVSRMSASALNAVGLPELIAEDLQQYEDTAVALALNPGKLDAIRHRLRKNRKDAPLFNTTLFTRHVEKAYAQVWHRHTAGLPPASLQMTP